MASFTQSENARVGDVKMIDNLEKRLDELYPKKHLPVTLLTYNWPGYNSHWRLPMCVKYPNWPTGLVR